MKKSFLIILLAAVQIAGQTINISDSLDVVSLQEFQVPQDKYIILTNIKKINFEAELLDSDQNKIRGIKNFSQFPGKEELPKLVQGDRGVLVQFAVNELIEESGIYYVKITANYVDEYGRDSKTGYYKVEVHNPTIASEINLRKDDPYFYSEKETFSFATMEYKDPSAYSFEIKNSAGKLIDSGSGSIIKLDKALNDLNNIGEELLISGKYNEKEFQYNKMDGSGTGNSSWTIRVAKPALEEFSDWTKSSENDETIISAWNKNAMRILYTYIGNTENGFVNVRPEPKNFNFTASPATMLENVKYQQSGNFLYITFDVNKKFLEQMQDCGQQEIDFAIQFTTQFGEKVRKEYSAVILK